MLIESTAHGGMFGSSARIDPEERLMNAAKALESSFIAEMLKGAGVGEVRQTLGGGIGEEQFASFLREGLAEAITEKGGLGLARSIFEALKAKSDD